MPAPANLVREETSSTGTSTLTLSAVNGYVRFSDSTYAFGTGGTDAFWYFISNRNAAEWEIGTGHMSDANTLVRDTVLFSSNSNAAVNFTAGTKDVCNDIPAGMQVRQEGGAVTNGHGVVFSGTSGSLVASSGYTPREVLTADRTYYVRTDGSDSNNGLANTSGGAFLTIQKAINVVAALDLSIYNITISVGDGTYAGGARVTGPFTGVGSVTIVGNTSTPSSCVISVTSTNCIYVSGGGSLIVGGFKLQTATGGHCVWAGGSARIYLTGAMEYGACAGVHIAATDFGYVSVGANYTISGSAGAHNYIETYGMIFSPSRTITLTGTPSFGTCFAFIGISPGFLDVRGNTYSGSATGKRYQLAGGGIINTNGGGSTYLPGNSSGTATVPGYYL